MLTIFQYDFMVRAFIAGFCIALIAPLIGTFLVVKRYALLADTLSHVSLVGVALALLFGFHPLLGAIVTACFAALGIERLREKSKAFGESILALFLSASLAIAVVLLSFSHNLNINILSYLFGSITTVSESDIIFIVLLAIGILLITVLFFKQFFILAYDEDLAKTSGLAVERLNILLMLLAAVTISLSIRIVGSLLMGALMVIPVLAAVQFKLSFLRTTILGVIISCLSVFAGLLFSFYLNLPSGGTIVIVAIVCYILSLIVNRKVA